MKSNSVVIEKQPIFLTKKKIKVPENNFLSCLHKSTKINICQPENIQVSKNEICHINNHKEYSFEELCSVNKDCDNRFRRNRNCSILSHERINYMSLLKKLAVLLLICDIFYLHVNLQNMEVSLQNSLRIIENLESQLKFSKMNYEMFKADESYLMYLNRMLTKDINSKIDLLIKLNNFFLNHVDSSLNSVVDVLRNRKSNNNDIVHVVKKRNTSSGSTKYSHLSKVLTFGESDNEDFQQSFDENGEYNAFMNNNSNRYEDSNDKNEMDSVVGLRNVTFESMSDASGGFRFKRQTLNNSRSNNRGKHNGKLKKRGQHRHVNCNLFCCSAGPLLAHFRGAQPEALIQDGGVIAPWFGDLDVSGDYVNRNYVLKEGKAKIEVTEKGLYLIYAQVYYLTSNSLNSYSINIQGEKEDTERVIALCSTEAAVKGLSEVSCYTSVATQLLPGDKVFLIQRERYRRVLFREGHTFLGIVALNNPPKC